MKVNSILLICMSFLSFGLLSSCTPRKIGGGGKIQPYNPKTGRYELGCISSNNYGIKLIILILFIVILLNKIYFLREKELK